MRKNPMTKTTLTMVTGVLLALASCGENPSEQSQTVKNNSADSVAAPPVETKEPNTAYQPAFPKQTRVAGVKSSTAYEGKVLTDDLEKPWGLTSMPDGRLMITQKAGTMRIASLSGEISAPITGIPKVNAEGQGGLLGVRLDPDFEQNRMVYWVFSEPLPEGNLTAVAKGKLSADEKKIEGATVIYRATPAYNGTLHYGGRILFDKDVNLIVSTGERSDTTAGAATQLQFGKNCPYHQRG